VILTNQCIMKLKAPGFARVHRAAERGVSPTSRMEVPPAEVRWAIPWQVHAHYCLPSSYSNTGPTLKLECNLCNVVQSQTALAKSNCSIGLHTLFDVWVLADKCVCKMMPHKLLLH